MVSSCARHGPVGSCVAVCDACDSARCAARHCRWPARGGPRPRTVDELGSRARPSAVDERGDASTQERACVAESAARRSETRRVRAAGGVVARRPVTRRIRQLLEQHARFMAAPGARSEKAWRTARAGVGDSSEESHLHKNPLSSQAARRSTLSSPDPGRARRAAMWKQG